MDNSDNSGNTENSIQKAQLVWDIYKYRHDLCWKLLFQTIIAVVLVSLAPYADENVARSLGYCMVVPPVAGIYLTGSALVRMETEFDLWERIKQNHFELQAKLELAETGDKGTRSFQNDLRGYLISLLVLSVVNVVAVAFFWIPYLKAMEDVKG